MTLRYIAASLVMVGGLFSAQGFTIIIDPGHGGIYTGGVSASGKVVEKNCALQIAKRLRDVLEKKDVKVILTRTEDKELDSTDLIEDLKKRAAFTVTHKADLLISLHFNSSPNTQLQGYEVYVPFEAQYPRKSYELASAVHYELSHKIEPQFGGGTLGNFNLIDRGIRASKFNVLTRASCPAVLVELAYLTHAPTAHALESNEMLNLLVDALYSGLRRYMLSR